MALPAVVESLDAVPEQVREFYRADADGKRFVLDSEDAGIGADELRRAHARTKEDLKKTKETLVKYASIGLSPDEVEALRAEKSAREREEAEKKGQFEKLLSQKDEVYRREREALDAERQSLLDAVQEHVVDAEANAAIANAKGRPKLLLPLVRAQLKAVKGEGKKYRVAVLDSDGEERRNPKTNEPMTVAELVAEMKADPEFGGAFEASGATGGGASVANTGARGADFSKLSPVEKLNRAFGTSGAN